MKLYQEAKVVVASTPICKYCKQAKSDLEQNNISFVDLDVSTRPALRTVIEKITGRATVPQVGFASNCIATLYSPANVHIIHIVTLIQTHRIDKRA